MKNRIIVVAAGAALLLGYVGFRTLDPPGADPLPPLAALYHALGLFVLNPGSRGLPAGEPGWALVALWAAHFLAPLSLASFLVDALMSLVRGRARSYEARSGHTIVCGLSRKALLLIEEIAERSSPDRVVAVELFPTNPQLPGVQERGVGVVMGSMTEETTLRRAGVRNARRLLAFAHDDILNINAVLLARKMNRARAFTTVAQVTDVKLVQNLPKGLKRTITFLNTYEVAADALVREHHLTSGRDDNYVVAGFGKFGQMMVKALLQERALAKGDRIYVLDRDAEQKVRVFVETFGFGEDDVQPMQGDLNDPALWRRVTDDIRAQDEEAEEPIVLICTDNDILNLSMALSVRRRYVRNSNIYCRLFGEVSFEKEMIKGEKIVTYRVSDLLRRNMPKEVLETRT